MRIQIDETNKQLVVEITPAEFDDVRATGLQAIAELQVYMNNFFTNKLDEIKQQHREEIRKKLLGADIAQMTAVLDVLKDKTKP